jgi:hypothetical protein
VECVAAPGDEVQGLGPISARIRQSAPPWPGTDVAVAAHFVASLPSRRRGD